LAAFVSVSSTSLAGHRFLCTDSYGGKVAVVAADGTIEWEYACQHPQDCWALPNGNFLFCHARGAIELSPAKQIVWEYQALEKAEVHACQPLPDGRVLVVECGPSRLLEIGRDGKIAKEIKLTPPPATVSLHDQYRGVRKTRDGHYLVCRLLLEKKKEIDTHGKSL